MHGTAILIFLPFLFVGLPPLAAQSATREPIQSTCGIARAKAFRKLLPVYPSPSVPSIADSLDLSFQEASAGHSAVAVAAARHAMAESIQHKDLCAEALAKFLIAGSAQDVTDEDKTELLRAAMETFNSLHSATGVGYSQLRLANLYARKSKFDLSNEHYQKAQQSFDSINDGYGSLFVRIQSLDSRGAPDFAALQAQAAALDEPCLQAAVQDEWASRAHTLGNFEDVILHGNLADSFYAHCSGAEGYRAATQTNLGRSEREQGRPLVALEHYRIALQLQRKSGDLSLVPQTYNAMAVAYENMKDYSHAIPLYRKALALARTLHSPPMVEFLEANLGTTYVKFGQPRLGIPLLLSATQDLSSDRLLCIRLEQLGFAYDAIGDHDRAIESLTSSLTACEKLQDSARILQSLEVLARAELHAHDYGDALRHARENIALLDSARARVVAQDAYKQGFFNDNLEAYGSAIAALTALNDPAEALEVAEQGRARAFLDLLASHPAKTEEASAAHTLDQYRRDLIDSPATAAALTMEAMLAESARLHSTLLAYWHSSDTLYIWVARPGEPVIEATRPITLRRLSALVAATRLPTVQGRMKAQSWRTLHQLLVAPVEAHLPRAEGSLLTVVPAGPLFALSFAALVSPRGTYLAERYRIHTIPSMALLTYTRRNAEAALRKPPHFLFVDNPEHMPVDLEHHALPPIPGTALEVDAITRLVPAQEVTRFEGKRADLNHLLMGLPEATTIHFATHAVLNDADPYSSFLALDDTQHGGRLDIAAIYALQLKSRLVILSACSSGLGKITGDGVAGMSRAFFYAGSAAVLNTLWDIADRPTANFLPRFYAGLMAGQSPSSALRAAQISMLNDLRHHRIHARGLSASVALPADPTYWAAFSLVGEP